MPTPIGQDEQFIYFDDGSQIPKAAFSKQQIGDLTSNMPVLPAAVPPGIKQYGGSWEPTPPVPMTGPGGQSVPVPTGFEVTPSAPKGYAPGEAIVGPPYQPKQTGAMQQIPGEIMLQQDIPDVGQPVPAPGDIGIAGVRMPRPGRYTLDYESPELLPTWGVASEADVGNMQRLIDFQVKKFAENIQSEPVPKEILAGVQERPFTDYASDVKRKRMMEMAMPEIKGMGLEEMKIPQPEVAPASPEQASEAFRKQAVGEYRNQLESSMMPEVGKPMGMEQALAGMKLRELEHQEQMQEGMKEIAQIRGDIKNFKIDPTKLFKVTGAEVAASQAETTGQLKEFASGLPSDMTSEARTKAIAQKSVELSKGIPKEGAIAGSKVAGFIVGIIGAALSTYGAMRAGRGDPNAGLNILMQGINRNIALQKEELAQKNRDLGYKLQELGMKRSFFKDDIAQEMALTSLGLNAIGVENNKIMQMAANKNRHQALQIQIDQGADRMMADAIYRQATLNENRRRNVALEQIARDKMAIEAYKAAQKSGGLKPLTPAMVSDMGDAMSAKTSIDDLTRAFQGTEGITSYAAAHMPFWETKTKLYNTKRVGFGQDLNRAINGGRASDLDFNKIMEQLPEYTDTMKFGYSKIGLLRDSAMSKQAGKIVAAALAGYDVDTFVQQFIQAWGVSPFAISTGQEMKGTTKIGPTQP